jgi:hypothetical protein
MYQFKFKSTIDDLLKAERIDRNLKSFHIVVRILLVLICFLFLGIGVIDIFFSHINIRALIWICIGLLIFFFLFLLPIINKRIIIKNNMIEVYVSIKFYDDCIKININNVNNYIRNWEELKFIKNSEDGILFFFSDNVINWLPRRVFTDENEKKIFLNFLEDKKNIIYHNRS